MNQILQVSDNQKQHKKNGVNKLVLFLLIDAIIIGLGIVYINISNGRINLPIFTESPEEIVEIDINKTQRNKLIINIPEDYTPEFYNKNINNIDFDIVSKGDKLLLHSYNLFSRLLL